MSPVRAPIPPGRLLPTGVPRRRRRPTVADRLVSLLHGLLGEPPALRVRGWDGSVAGPADARATLDVRSPDALRRILYRPDEVGLARAYVRGDLDVDGDLFAALEALEPIVHPEVRGDGRPMPRGARLRALVTAVRLGAIGAPLPPPPEEVDGSPRDAEAIQHHYDAGNAFYALLLGPSMVYSCAYWPHAGTTLEEAQAAKLELVCRKLGLRPGMRLLDVGCGWGSLLIHAAREHGVSGVGLTLSPAQAELARRRVEEAGLTGRIEIRLQHYEDAADGPYDAVASVGMAEHVGADRLDGYARRLAALVAPGGRVLNHAIARKPGPPPDHRKSFVSRYVFPDGDLQPLGTTVDALERAGLEVRDVECIREHYGRTCRAWIERLEARMDAAEREVGVRRARIWRLYIAGSALAFERGHVGVNQVLAVCVGPRGESGMPPTRAPYTL